MNSNKRRLASFILLSVFVPMIILTSVHIHKPVTSDAEVCRLCLLHIQHPNHFQQHSAAFSQCLLCQLSSLPYVEPACIDLIAFTSFVSSVPDSFSREPSSTVKGVKSTRAPPYFLL
jgi:hypothetical protein